MSWIWKRIQDEPVVTQNVIIGLIFAGTQFGLDWTAAQVGGVTGASALILTWLTRQAVSPVGGRSLPPPLPPR